MSINAIDFAICAANAAFDEAGIFIIAGGTLDESIRSQFSSLLDVLGEKGVPAGEQRKALNAFERRVTQLRREWRNN